MERLDLRSLISQVKLLGTLVLISGALIVTLYKGPAIGAVPLPQPSSSTPVTATNDWVIGGIFLATASISIAILIVFSGKRQFHATTRKLCNFSLN